MTLKGLGLAKQNARKITDLLINGTGHADLYRTIESGPSGQRHDLLIARVRYLTDGSDDFEIVDIADGRRAGFARRTYVVAGVPRGGIAWSITAEHDGSSCFAWRGYASSLSVGCDVLINGEHAALGRHDNRRISSGWFRSADQIHAAHRRSIEDGGR